MENGTGVYYQAMPAVGPDGKNVMKLIPVQKVNGKFVQTHVLSTRTDHQPQVHRHPTHLSPVSLPQNKLPTLQPTADGRFVLKMPPDSNVLLNPLKSQQQGSNDLSKNTLNPVRPPLVIPNLTQNALQLPLQSNNNPVTVISSPQQPVSGKSPILSSGHYLQIPPNATVRTVPASALPQSIKSQICNSLNAPSNSAKGLPTVVYVSPVNSLKLGPGEQIPGFMKETEHTQSLTPMPTISSVKTLSATSASPKPDKGATTPMKWVVQEGTGSSVPFLIPVTSPSMTTDIIKAVKQMETKKQMDQGTAGKHTSTSTTAIQEKISPGKDSAIVMCNGKVYFVAKKSSENTKDVISGAGNSLSMRDFVQPSSATNTVPKQDSVQTPSSKNPNEVIDLCDDEEESSPSTTLSRLSVLNEMASENDEDSNVIFVSYIPPKSETESSTKAAHTSPQNQSGKDKNSPECDTQNSPVIDLDVSRCEDNTAADERVNGGGAVSEEVCKEVTETISVDSGIQCRQDQEAHTEMSWDEPALKEVQQEKSDSELRKIFGIMSDVRICLQRVNEAKAASPKPERRTVNKRTLEGIRKLIQGSQIQQKVKKLIDAQVQVPKEKNGPEDAKRKRLAGHEQKTCSDTSVSSVVNSSLQWKDTVKCHSEMQSVSTDACTDSKVLLYCQGPDEENPIEPLCSSSSTFQSQQTQTAVCDTNGKACMAVSRRTPPRQSKGNGRVCTVCPCGTKVGAIAAISSSKPCEKPNRPAVIDSFKQASVLTESNGDCNNVGQVLKKPVSSPPKSSVASEKSGDEMLHSTELHIKPGKGLSLNPSSLSVQHDVSQSSSSSKGETSSSSSFIELYSSVMLDPEELKRQERIKRLKVLLREKEAALEKLRQTM